MTTNLTQRADEQQDVPSLEAGLTSSIGALWPAQRASFDRIKGVYTPNVITLPEQARIFNQTGEELFVQSGAGRVSIRAVARNEVITPVFLPHLEAAIPLDRTQKAFSGTSLIYLGWNKPTRVSNPQDLVASFQEVERARTIAKRNLHDMVRHSSQQGYELDILDSEDTRDQQTILTMTRLYERFGWEEEDVRQILDCRTNIIGIARHQGEIVSSGILELALIPIGSHRLRIAEITEAATREDHTRNGLYLAVSSLLLLELAQRSREHRILGGEIDIVFGECNGNAPGVLRTAQFQGRTFATESTRRFGFEDRGYLCQHVPIQGAPRQTVYNDLFPAYLARQTLYQRADQ